jgi:hypothetical protein
MESQNYLDWLPLDMLVETYDLIFANVPKFIHEGIDYFEIFRAVEHRSLACLALGVYFLDNIQIVDEVLDLHFDRYGALQGGKVLSYKPWSWTFVVRGEINIRFINARLNSLVNSWNGIRSGNRDESKSVVFNIELGQNNKYNTSAGIFVNRNILVIQEELLLEKNDAYSLMRCCFSDEKVYDKWYREL